MELWLIILSNGAGMEICAWKEPRWISEPWKPLVEASGGSLGVGVASPFPLATIPPLQGQLGTTTSVPLVKVSSYRGREAQSGLHRH